MTTSTHITLSEFQTLLKGIPLPERPAMAIAQRNKALEALHKLRGSGNGNLLRVLLEDREREKTL